MAHAQQANTHDENRFKVCIICMEKGDCKISDVVKQRIHAYFIENYDVNDQCCPAAICARCRAHLLDIESGKKDPSVLPTPYDFSQITPFVRPTRANPSPVCECCICLTARRRSVPSRRKGRPSTETPKSSFSNVEHRVAKLCLNCKSPVRRGWYHK